MAQAIEQGCFSEHFALGAELTGGPHVVASSDCWFATTMVNVHCSVGPASRGYRAFGPLVDILPLIPVFSCFWPCVAGLGGFPLITAQANCGSDSMRRQRLGS